MALAYRVDDGGLVRDFTEVPLIAPPAKKDAPPVPAVSRKGKTEKVPVVTPAVLAAADAAPAAVTPPPPVPLPTPADAPLSGQAEDASAAKAAADSLAAHGAPVPAAVVPVPPVVPAPPPPVLPPVSVAEIRLTGPAGDLVVKDPGEYNLGRAKDAPLRVDNPTVSRRHALIVLTADRQAFVDDGGGANGTRLNGATVTTRTRLTDGDLISVGEVELRVKLVSGG